MAKTRKRKLINRSNYDHTKQGEPENTLSTMTKPDQTLTIKQLIERFTRGQSIATLSPKWYSSPENISEFEGEFDNMDKFEKMDLKRRTTKEAEAYMEVRRTRQEYLDKLAEEEAAKAAKKTPPADSPKPEPKAEE